MTAFTLSLFNASQEIVDFINNLSVHNCSPLAAFDLLVTCTKTWVLRFANPQLTYCNQWVFRAKIPQWLGSASYRACRESDSM